MAASDGQLYRIIAQIIGTRIEWHAQIWGFFESYNIWYRLWKHYKNSSGRDADSAFEGGIPLTAIDALLCHMKNLQHVTKVDMLFVEFLNLLRERLKNENS